MNGDTIAGDAAPGGYRAIPLAASSTEPRGDAADPAAEEAPVGKAVVVLKEREIIAIMQASVKAGEIKEFTFEQVQAWKGGEDEEVDGESYQTGTAAYKAQTIFGERVVQAKALIKDRKVKKWIYAKTGMEIR